MISCVIAIVALLGTAPSRPIGAALNQHKLNQTEQTLFEHDCADGTSAVLSHFWAGGGSPGTDDALIRYYVDGESKPSIMFTPARAVGLEFSSSKRMPAPWSAGSWMGKGAHATGFWHNFRVPFRSIRVTFQKNPSANDTLIYLIVRGAEKLMPVRVGDVELPPTARLRTQTRRFEVRPLERYDLLQVPRSRGMVLMTSVSVQHARPNVQYLEACFRFFSPPSAQWPGTVVLSTGGEDYYDSAFYFDAGPFQQPVSGVTHLNISNSSSEWSAYRFHDVDPLIFDDGARLSWRHGDTFDKATGHKCGLFQGGDMIGQLGPANVSTMAWWYEW